MTYRAKPLLLVIFGISGNLAHRKLLPALYQLFRSGELPESFHVVGVTRHDYDVDTLFDDFKKYLPDGNLLAATASALKSHITIVKSDLMNRDDYTVLKRELQHTSSALGEGTSRIYYLSIPAQAFETVVTNLGETDHNEMFEGEAGLPRLLIEKPFGYDLTSAQRLIATADQYFDESQLYRIDHYLAKETAQNILTFRFSNPLFRSIWNSRFIDHIHIVAHESIGIEGRTEFYEQTGALRDIIQSHLLQLAALVTMEQPAEMTSEAIHRSKLRLMQSIIPIKREDLPAAAKRGQYDTYRQEVADRTSKTETFARLRIAIDNEQWRGTTIELETGKALDRRDSQVAVHFRQTDTVAGTNTLIFRIQPQEGITLMLQAKKPGLDNETKTVDMEFDYARSFGETSAEAYERVIMDAIRGDQSLFASGGEVIAAWTIVENVLQYWRENQNDLVLYATGTNPAKL